MRDKWETQGEPLPQWKFMQLYDSNLIAQAVVNYNPQNPLLVEIIGKYIVADKDGKVINGENGRPKEVSFRTQAARLTEKYEGRLFRDPRIEPRVPNTMLLSVVWSVLPIVVIAALI